MLLNALTLGEIFSIGGLTAFIGMSITFTLLVILILALVLMDKSSKLTKKRKSNDNSDKPTANTAIGEKTTEDEEQELVAGIISAISIILSQETKTQSTSRASFVVKSIKRI